jgi:hypothetical protein
MSYQPEHLALLTRAEKIAQDCRTDLFDVEENVHLLKTVLATIAKHPLGSAERKGYSAIEPALVTAIVTRLHAICFDATGWGKPGRANIILNDKKSCFTDAVFLIKGGDSQRDAVRDQILRNRTYLQARWEGWTPVLLIIDREGKVTDELQPPDKEVHLRLSEKRQRMDDAMGAWESLWSHECFLRFHESRHHTFAHNVKNIGASEAYGLTFPELIGLAEQTTAAMAAICHTHFGFSSKLSPPLRGDRFLRITKDDCVDSGNKTSPTGNEF